MMLQIGSYRFSKEELLTVNLTMWEAKLPENGYQALVFSHQWLTGVTTFSVSTSGSTGNPKPIAITRKQFESSARLTIDALKLSSQDHFLVPLSMYHIGGIMLLVRGLMLRASITVMEPSSNLTKLIAEDHSFTITSLVPMQIQTMLSNYGRKTLNQFHCILLGGAPVSDALIKEVVQLKPQIFHTYGMTETVSHVALRQLSPTLDLGFKPLPGVELRSGAEGCAEIRGEVTQGHWLYTQDLIRWIDEGHFEILGRVDETINTGGVKVAAYKVEAALKQVLPAIEPQPKRFFVSSMPHDVLGEQVTCFFEMDDPGTNWQGQVRSELTKLLGKYEVPKKNVFCKEFIFTASGKVDKKKTVLNC